MFLGRNRSLFQSGAPGEGGGSGLGENTEFLNTVKNMPLGMQRFLAKKGIHSSDDLANLVQSAFKKLR